MRSPRLEGSSASVDISAFSSKGSIGFGPRARPRTTRHSNTGSYLSIFMSNTYTERRKMQMSCVSAPQIRVQFSRNPREDIRFLSYVRIYMYIYITLERKDSPFLRSLSRVRNFLLRQGRELYPKVKTKSERLCNLHNKHFGRVSRGILLGNVTINFPRAGTRNNGKNRGRNSCFSLLSRPLHVLHMR